MRYLFKSLLVIGICQQLRRVIWHYLLVSAMLEDKRFQIGDIIRTTVNGKAVTGTVLKVGWFAVSIENETGSVFSVPNDKLLVALENLTLQKHQRLQIELGVNLLHSVKVRSDITSYLESFAEENLVKSKTQVLLKKYDGDKKLMVLLISCLIKKESFKQINVGIHAKLVEVISASEFESTIPTDTRVMKQTTPDVRTSEAAPTIQPSDRSVAVPCTNDDDNKLVEVISATDTRVLNQTTPHEAPTISPYERSAAVPCTDNDDDNKVD